MSDLVVSGMFLPPQTFGTVLCCICGDCMPPNPANMCVRCISSRVDITEGLPRRDVLYYCPDCRSYLEPPRTWKRADLESKHLLDLCLKRLNPVLKRSHVKIENADFVWTEPHSKRIKLCLHISKKAVNGATLEKSYEVEFTQNDKLCDSCALFQSNPDQWVAAVQLRQHVSHRRTFFYLEQLLLQHRAAARAIRIKEAHRGVDFFFRNPSHADRFLDFISNFVPVQSRSDKRLVSHDHKSNICKNQHTFSVEICPICREDLICLPPKVARDIGNLGPVVLCTKISNSIKLLDPLTLKSAYLDAKKYWASPFTALLSSRQLVEYIVLDVEMNSSGIVGGESKYASAYVQVARLSDFGKNDNIFIVKTHLGHLLNPGDYALGYDLYGANVDDTEINKYKNLDLPHVILVKKYYEEMKSLNMEVDRTAKRRPDEEKRTAEYEEFLRDLEENPEMRFNVSIAGEDLLSVSLNKLIAELNISDEEERIADSMKE